MGRLHEEVTEGIKGRAARPGGAAVIGARRFSTVRAGRDRAARGWAGQGGMAAEVTEGSGGDGGDSARRGLGTVRGVAGRAEGGRPRTWRLRCVTGGLSVGGRR